MSTVLECPEGEDFYQISATLPLRPGDPISTWDDDVESKWIVRSIYWHFDTDPFGGQRRGHLHAVVEPVAP